MIEVVHLGKRYGEIVAIDDVNFSVAKGEILAFLGPNGAGKTTTMRILTCFMPATSGTAKVAGFDIFESPMEVKRRIGYLPDNPPLYPEMTVSEYLQFVAKIKGVANQRVKAALASALEKCNLGDVARRLIGNLSRGYRQRVGLAQAMIHNPDVLILDEPTVGLDPKQIIEIRELIKGLGGEHTIVLSTHILPEATAVSQKVVIINRGRIVAVDSQERLSAQVRKSEKISVRVRRGEAFDPEKIVSIEGVQQLLPQPAQPSMNGEGVFIVESELGRDIREELSKRVVECGWGLLEMKPLAVSLEEVFLQLTTEEKGVEEAAAAPVAPGEVPA
ncbi:ABC transporter ATP-binding protein [Candidatus Manganitrophus noduliformans]|uniref:ATP-binding cassette domain-containing protein n=1 Tax=Candidatus Manganitrophus noduliformans TaxID=2606439 RepID=A0A7X6DND0_9BACT|nr:ATP-binding cassette domain-containing protein [Candidatus Manganitrophus noduliformans]NKE70307.1 ATP-binding cassette domain-containing protein [Candidatus Manganitrophus noduliformans]